MMLLVYLLKHNQDSQFENKESSDTTRKSLKEESVNLFDMQLLGGDEEEVKEGKGLKTLTRNKLCTRLLPLLVVQTKAGNNSQKLKNEIRKILYLLYQNNKIPPKKVYNNLIKSL